MRDTEILKAQGRRSTKGLKIVRLLRQHSFYADLTGAMDSRSQLNGRTVFYGIFRVTRLGLVPLEFNHQNANGNKAFSISEMRDEAARVAREWPSCFGT